MTLNWYLVIGIITTIRFGHPKGLTVGTSDQQVTYVEPYRYGERTRGLRNALLAMHLMPIDNELLVQEGEGWVLRQNGTSLRLTTQGVSRDFVTRRNVFARTEDGKWHRFKGAASEFNKYVEQLPMQYEGLTRVSFDGREWFSYNSYGECRRLLLGGRDKGMYMFSMDEDGQWHRFTIDPRMQSFVDYIRRLPPYVSELHRTDLTSAVAEMARSVRESSGGGQSSDDWDGRFASPDIGLRDAMMKKRLLAPSDDRLARRPSGWSVVDAKGRGHIIIKEGLGLETKDKTLFARTDDGRWHQFSNYSVIFRNYLAQLPKHFDLGGFVFDGHVWYVRNLLGQFEMATKVKYNGLGESLRFITANGTAHYCYKVKFPSIQTTVY